MDQARLQELVTAGRDFQESKYVVHAAMTLVVWDHLITLRDEVKYVWKKEKSWTFWLFIVNRYSILLFKAWLAIASFWPGYTQEACNHTIRLAGYYFIFIVALGHVFLTMRVYALTEASKYVLVVFGILVTSSFATGLWFVSVPSAGAVQMPKVPLDSFRACIFTARGATEWAYRSQVAIADLITFICVVVFVLKLKAGYGQSRLNRLMRTILQDGVLYFFVMAAFHIAMVFFAFFGRPSVRSFAPAATTVLIPVMISRLVVSLRKAADTSVVQVWDGDHFTSAESGGHEMMNFAPPPPP